MEEKAYTNFVFLLRFVCVRACCCVPLQKGGRECVKRVKRRTKKGLTNNSEPDVFELGFDRFRDTQCVMKGRNKGVRSNGIWR